MSIRFYGGTSTNKPTEKRKRCPKGSRKYLNDCKKNVDFLIQELNFNDSQIVKLERIATNLFFNIQNKKGKDNTLKILNQVEPLIKSYVKKVNAFLNKYKPERETSSTKRDHSDVIDILKSFSKSNQKDQSILNDLKSIVENFKERVEKYVKRNIENVKKLVIDENDPNYKDEPDWDDLYMYQNMFQR